ncbi:MAG: hypothetical protein RL329_1559 [Bacteroidota bacterium]
MHWLSIICVVFNLFNFQGNVLAQTVEVKNLSSRQYQEQFNKLTQVGYRPIKVTSKVLQVIDLPDGELSQLGYWATFQKQPNSPAWAAQHGLTSDAYQQSFNHWTAQGYLPTDIVTIATFFIQKDTMLYYFSYLCVMKAREVLKKYSISRNTLHHWVKRGKISYGRTPTGQYDYFPVEASVAGASERATVVYARVSTSAQQENLNRQIERLKAFCSARGYILDTLYFDIGSALNYNRKKYAKLYQAIVEKKVGRLVIEYKDRLLRFGFEDFERLCALLGTELIVLDHTKGSKSNESEMTEDLISIIHHFSMRLYSSRRGKKVLSDIETILNENNQTIDVDSQIET